MSPLDKNPDFYSFGPFRFDLAPYRLTRGVETIEITPQQAQLLEILIAQNGTVVSRDSIRKDLWSADIHVDFDRSINYAIARLRSALGDRSEAPRYIETVPRRGYRFVAALEEPKSRAESPPESPAVEEESVEEERVAQAPEDSLGVIPATEEGRRGADSLASTQPPGANYRKTGANYRKIRFAILGLVLLSSLIWWATRGSSTSPRGELEEAPNAGQIASSTGLSDLGLASREDIADSQATPPVKACESFGPDAQLSPPAATAFHRGSHFASLSGPEERGKAIAAFDEVLAHHPDFEPAIACQARLFYLRSDWRRAEPLARRALELRPDRVEALLILAEVAFRHHFDWPLAESRFQSALELYPRNEVLRVAYASLLSAMGRKNEATSLARGTLELHPLSLFARSELAEELYLAGDYGEAIEIAERVVQVDHRRTEAFFIILHSHLGRGDRTAALASVNRMLSAFGWGEAKATELDDFWNLKIKYRDHADHADPDQLSELATLTMALGKREEARRLMERACTERSGWSLPYYDVDPRFSPFHTIAGLESLTTCLRQPFDLGRAGEPPRPETTQVARVPPPSP